MIQRAAGFPLVSLRGTTAGCSEQKKTAKNFHIAQ